MYETYTTVQGRLVADPVVKQGRYGAFTTFRVAQSERHQVRDEPGRWADSEPNFYDVSVSRSSGENAARCLRKGHPVVVHGRLRVRQFRRDDGSYGTAVELEAYSLGHDLRWGVTSFTRNGDRAAAAGHGDPERDAYVVLEAGAEPEPASPDPAPHVDSGPLVPPAEPRVA